MKFSTKIVPFILMKVTEYDQVRDQLFLEWNGLGPDKFVKITWIKFTSLPTIVSYRELFGQQ